MTNVHEAKISCFTSIFRSLKHFHFSQSYKLAQYITIYLNTAFPIFIIIEVKLVKNFKKSLASSFSSERFFPAEVIACFSDTFNVATLSYLTWQHWCLRGLQRNPNQTSFFGAVSAHQQTSTTDLRGKVVSYVWSEGSFAEMFCFGSKFVNLGPLFKTLDEKRLLCWNVKLHHSHYHFSVRLHFRWTKKAIRTFNKYRLKCFEWVVSGATQIKKMF